MDPETEKIKTPEYVTLQFQLAGLGSRATALILDLIAIGLAYLIIGVTAGLVFTNNSPLVNASVDVGMAIILLLIFGIYWGYFFVCEYFFGGKTIGKKMIGIRVIQDNGHSLTLLSAVIRNLMRIIDMLPTAYFLGIVLIFFHPRHKRLGDMTAGTVVVHERAAKRKKKTTPLEQEIARKGLTKDMLTIQQPTLRTLGSKDWKLINTYSQRLTQLPPAERNQRTWQVASILFPKVGLEMSGRNEQELENLLLVLYLKLKDEWEYEL